MKIFYCLLAIAACVFLIYAMQVQGAPLMAIWFVLGLLCWIFMLGREIDRAMTRLPRWIIGRAMKTPYFHLDGYMERYWFFRIGKRGGGQSGPSPLFGARVHHILRSDDGRDFHDHPWPYLTIILAGGYWEVRPVLVDNVVSYTRRRWHGPGSVLLRRANSWHRLELPKGTTAWTLFATGPKVQPWGFLVGRKKVYWRDYLNVPAGVGED